MNAIQTLLLAKAFSSDQPINRSMFKVGAVKGIDLNTLIVGTYGKGWSASVLLLDAGAERLEVLIFKESAEELADMLRKGEFPDSVDEFTARFAPGWAWEVHALIQTCAYQ